MRSIARRSALVVAGTAAASLAVAAPATALPPLQFDQPCYSVGAPIGMTGAGFTPGGEVSLFAMRDGRLGMFNPIVADAAGNIADTLAIGDASDFLDDDELRGTVVMTANDQTRMNDGGPPSFDEEAAPGQFTITRFGFDLRPRVSDRRLKPGKPILVDVYGFAEATGRTLYLHWTRGGKRLKSVRLGTATGACGDVRKLSRAFPFTRPRAGTYRVYVSDSSRKPEGGIWLGFNIKLLRKDVRR